MKWDGSSCADPSRKHSPLSVWPAGRLASNHWRTACLTALGNVEPVDLLAEFALPWCLELALLVVGALPDDRDRF